MCVCVRACERVCVCVCVCYIIVEPLNNVTFGKLFCSLLKGFLSSEVINVLAL